MKIVTVISARPQFIKVAAHLRAILQHNETSYDPIREIINYSYRQAFRQKYVRSVF